MKLLPHLFLGCETRARFRFDNKEQHASNTRSTPYNVAFTDISVYLFHLHGVEPFSDVLSMARRLEYLPEMQEFGDSISKKALSYIFFFNCYSQYLFLFSVPE